MTKISSAWVAKILKDNRACRTQYDGSIDTITLMAMAIAMKHFSIRHNSSIRRLILNQKRFLDQGSSWFHHCFIMTWK